MKTQLWLSLLPFLVAFTTKCSGNPDTKRLLVDLFKKNDYDSSIRPVVRDDLNITVRMGVSLQEVTNLDEPTGQMSYRTILSLTWPDYQLRWEPKEYGGVTKLFLSPNQIWTPDVDLYNGVKNKIRKDVKLMVFYNGDVQWMPPADFTSTCTHEFRSDSWHCPLKFRSWTYTGKELDVKPLQGVTDMNVDEVERSMHYIVISTTGNRSLKEYPCCIDPFPTISFLMKIRNKIGHPALIGKRSLRGF